MGNMDYCKFRNTLDDLKQCLDDMFTVQEDAEEEKARENMIDICREIADNSEFFGDD